MGTSWRYHTDYNSKSSTSFASIMNLFQSALLFDISVHFLILHLLISVGTQFQHLRWNHPIVYLTVKWHLVLFIHLTFFFLLFLFFFIKSSPILFLVNFPGDYYCIFDFSYYPFYEQDQHNYKFLKFSVTFFLKRFSQKQPAI